MPLFDNNDIDRDISIVEFNRLKKFAMFELKTKPHQSILGRETICLTFNEMFDLRRKFNYLLKDIPKEKKQTTMEKLWSKRQTLSSEPINSYHPVIEKCFNCGVNYDSYNGGSCKCGYRN